MATGIARSIIIQSWSGLPISGLLHEAATLTQASDDINYPAASGGYATSLVSMRSVSGTIDGLLPTPQIGNAGVVAYSSGYVVGVRNFNINVSCPAVESTVFDAAGATGSRYMAYTPGIVTWSGSYQALADSATGIDEAGEDAPAEATFTLSSGNTLVGNIYTTQLGLPRRIGDLAVVDYAFKGSGTLEATGTNNFFTDADPIATPSASALTFRFKEADATDGSFAISAFWTSVNLTVSPGAQTKAQIGWQGTGAVTNTDPADA